MSLRILTNHKLDVPGYTVVITFFCSLCGAISWFAKILESWISHDQKSTKKGSHWRRSASVRRLRHGRCGWTGDGRGAISVWSVDFCPPSRGETWRGCTGYQSWKMPWLNGQIFFQASSDSCAIEIRDVFSKCLEPNFVAILGPGVIAVGWKLFQVVRKTFVFVVVFFTSNPAPSFGVNSWEFTIFDSLKLYQKVVVSSSFVET